MLRKVVTWMYLKLVFFPLLREMQEREKTEAMFLPRAVDKNWREMEAAMMQRPHNTLH